MWHRLKTLWRNLTHKEIVDDDLAQELHSYQTMLADEKSRAGIDPSAALRAARLEMEGLEQIKENVRDVRLGVAIETFFSELRQSLRGLSRNKGLSILCIAMLALGHRRQHGQSSASSTQPWFSLCPFAIPATWLSCAKHA